ncbi:MAG: UDP-N-acetylmuramate dehydrogenase [Chloroflexi bacterium]|nr:UDP-N-acetylmuramate dehydrogenase [Chloroflexota bacterium]
MATTLPLEALRAAFGERLAEQQSIARYTSARIGGLADALIVVRSADQLSETATTLHAMSLPFMILGGGSNILVSDAGVRQVVLLNHARRIRFDDRFVWAESGASLGAIARQAAAKGLSGLEWAAGIPGTLGGAVVGNAGAHGGETAQNLELAEILHLEDGRQVWAAEQLDFNYRASRLKAHPEKALVLAASLKLKPRPVEEIRAEMDTYLAYRRLTQPPGASMGSMFKNPPDDHAGRLIEAAGFKGKRIGNAQISPLHANFFLNLGDATSEDVYDLIQLAQKKVKDETGVQLELEIKLIGDWKEAH